MGNAYIDYKDLDGIQRRSLVSSPDIEPAEGIPVSFDIDRLFADYPLDFRIRVVNEFWAQGLITRDDFLAHDAPDRIRRALQSTYKVDTVEIINFAKLSGA